MKPLIFAAFLSAVLGMAKARANTQYLVNGKQSNPSQAVLAAMDAKNTVLQCNQVTAKVNAKGNVSLKKTDTNGDWQPVTK